MINIYNIDQYKFDYLCANQNSISRKLLYDIDADERDIRSVATGILEIQEIASELINMQINRREKIEERRKKVAKTEEKEDEEETINPILVWDMRRVTCGPLRDLDLVFASLIETSYSGIVFLIEDEKSEIYKRVSKAIKRLTKNQSEDYSKAIEGSLYYGDKVALENFKTNLHQEHIYCFVDNSINRLIFLWLESKAPKGKIKNHSSNVYVTRYFDAKKLFANGSIFNLVIHRMALMILQSIAMFNQNNTDFDAFVCGSITGACLAAGLSSVFNKPIIYLKNIGPSIMAKDGRMFELLKKDRKYVFVFDFMCLGKEYERMKLLCNLSSSKMVCCAGISCFRFPRFEEPDEKEEEYEKMMCFNWNKKLKIATLFHVNEYKHDYYEVEVQ